MIRRPPRSTRTDTLFPYTTLFRSEATCTGSAPSGVKLDGLRRPTGKPDTLPADLAPMGLDPRSWPRTEGSERVGRRTLLRSEEHTSELQSLMRISYAVFCLKKKNPATHTQENENTHRERTRT